MKRKGVTLIEALVSAVIMSIAITGSMFCFSNNNKVVMDNYRFNQLAMIPARILERVGNRRFENYPPFKDHNSPSNATKEWTVDGVETEVHYELSTAPEFLGMNALTQVRVHLEWYNLPRSTGDEPQTMEFALVQRYTKTQTTN